MADPKIAAMMAKAEARKKGRKQSALQNLMEEEAGADDGAAAPARRASEAEGDEGEKTRTEEEAAGNAAENRSENRKLERNFSRRSVSSTRNTSSRARRKQFGLSGIDKSKIQSSIPKQNNLIPKRETPLWSQYSMLKDAIKKKFDHFVEDATGTNIDLFEDDLDEWERLMVQRVDYEKPEPKCRDDVLPPAGCWDEEHLHIMGNTIDTSAWETPPGTAGFVAPGTADGKAVNGGGVGGVNGGQTGKAGKKVGDMGDRYALPKK